MKSSQIIAERIIKRLAELKWRRKDLAVRMGVAASVVTQWTSGSHNFTLETLDKIGEILGINLFTGNTAPEAAPCRPCEYKSFNQ